MMSRLRHDRRGRFSLWLGVLCGLFWLSAWPGTDPAFAQGPSASASRAYQRALGALQTGRVDQALAHLKPYLDAEPDDATALGIGRLHAALTGGYAERQAGWRDRRVADVVVLVSDARGFRAAIDGWTEDLFYPVLLDEAWYAPMFIEAFKPGRIVRFESTEPGPLSAERRDRWIAAHNAALTPAGRGADQPPGLVLIQPEGEYTLAGMALAAGRRQPIETLDWPGTGGRIAEPERVAAMNAHIRARLKHWRLTDADRLVGLTLAGAFPYRYRPADGKGFLAVDDALGRAENNLRLAVTGRLTGGEAGSVYQAMSALFLQPERALLFDDYAARGRGFRPYTLDAAARLLQPRLAVDLVQRESVTRAGFRQRAADRPGLIWITSAGMAGWWQVEGGNARADASDMPAGFPYALLAVHSFAGANPYGGGTIGGRALLGGAYWFYGSVHEPYLRAFTPTGLVAARLAAGAPWGVALRQPIGVGQREPWKLMAVGDPLFALRDEPAPRDNDATPQPAGGTIKPLERTESNDPAAAFRAAMMRGRTEAAMPHAAAMVRQRAWDRAEDLHRALVVLHDAGRAEPFEALQPADVARHRIAAERAWAMVGRRFARTMREDPRAASEQVKHVIQFAVQPNALKQRLTQWVQAMAEHDLDDQARQYLKQLSDDLRLGRRIQKAVREIASP